MAFLNNLELYTNCWLDLRLFLYSVSLEHSDDYPFVDDVLQLMDKIERKYDEH